MCRMFGVIGKSFPKNDDLINAIISSWIKSAEDDPMLNILHPALTNILPGHPHGWGLLTWSQNTFNGTDLNYKRTIQPLGRTHETQVQQWLQTNLSSAVLHFIGGHTRRASPSMPISLIQIHPFVLDLDPFFSSMFFMHNGTTDKEALNTLLQKPFSSSALYRYSDTQIMALAFKEHLVTNESPLNLSFILDFVSKVINSHQMLNWSGLQLILGIVTPSSKELSKIWYVSCVNPAYHTDPEALLNYFQLYLGQKNSQYFFCSSTIQHYFEKSFPSEINWQIIPNFQIGQ
ncbi:MAG: hypothetical protein ACFFBD_16490, partial [Candidatus Hodarchaeota archaeon]